jgi:hypothetical protein
MQPHRIAERGGVQAVEQRAARVRVHLDQPRARGRDVEVVAHEHAEIAGCCARERIGSEVHALLVGGRVGDPEQDLDRAPDREELLVRQRDDRAPRVRNRWRAHRIQRPGANERSSSTDSETVLAAFWRSTLRALPSLRRTISALPSASPFGPIVTR